MPESDDNAWLKSAHCRGHDPSIFFSEDTQRAKYVCGQCTVSYQCLKDCIALEDKLGHRNGVFGNTTSEERYKRYGTPRLTR